MPLGATQVGSSPNEANSQGVLSMKQLMPNSTPWKKTPRRGKPKVVQLPLEVLDERGPDAAILAVKFFANDVLPLGQARSARILLPRLLALGACQIRDNLAPDRAPIFSPLETHRRHVDEPPKFR